MGFTQSAAPKTRLYDLRVKLKEQNIDGFIIPRTDEFQGEYVPARSDRLRWLTGFSGSAGSAVILPNKAAIFVDGRYTIQVVDEIDSNLFEIFNSGETAPHQWIVKNLEKDAKFAIDPWLFTENAIRNIEKSVKSIDAELIYLSINPIDQIWHNQPDAPLSDISIHPLEYSGVAALQKLCNMGEKIADLGADYAVITASDSIAWLLNIRGNDVPNCPLVLSFGILSKNGDFDLFVDKRKLTPSVNEYFNGLVNINDFDKFSDSLKELSKSDKTILIDKNTSALAISIIFENSMTKTIDAPDPCQIAKACKNNVEIAGSITAHKRDGEKITRFLCWLDGLDKNQDIYELDMVEKLAKLRREDKLFRDESFDTIAGVGENGAICHYRVNTESNRKFNKNDILLVDSGGQYLDGTTDITRTIAIGDIDHMVKRNFTLVLKGHIALANQKFPKGITGSNLDAIARAPLWQYGLDFDHGTGHGVGSYLNVHEGPQRISKAVNNIALAEGMIISNEPGYYQAGKYGIRIESLLVVRLHKKSDGDAPDILAFETITLAPIDLNLVNVDLLNNDEIKWLNDYHAMVKSTISPMVDNKTKAWLVNATRPI